jgi:hypothetical protein
MLLLRDVKRRAEVVDLMEFHLRDIRCCPTGLEI